MRIEKVIAKEKKGLWKSSRICREVQISYVAYFNVPHLVERLHCRIVLKNDRSFNKYQQGKFRSSEAMENRLAIQTKYVICYPFN